MDAINLSTERKKKFIIDNSNILTKDLKITILSIIMMKIGKSVIIENVNKRNGIDIDLDKLKDIEILNYIYNIVKKRLDVLNQPVRNDFLTNELL